jgi:perosamine synthetase
VINYAKHFIDQDDIEAVSKVLESKFLTTGPKVKEFEKELVRYTGYKYCKAMNSGTAALHAACYAINLKSDDEVIIPSISFVATANCITYMGGKPIFADIDPDTLLIDPESIKRLITSKTKAVISMDYAGQLCDFKAIRKICDDNNLVFINDSCHSFGGINTIAKNTIPHIVCYSFHPAKHITTGEGGALLTNDLIIDIRAKTFRNHGRENYEMNSLGYNYKMSDINAALGISQLKKHAAFQMRRYVLIDRYNINLKCEKLIQIENRIHVYHLYVIKINKREEFIKYMYDKGIQCVVHFKPIYDHVYYHHLRNESNCPNTEKTKDKIVSIPLYYSLANREQEYIIKCINDFVEVDND